MIELPIDLIYVLMEDIEGESIRGAINYLSSNDYMGCLMISSNDNSLYLWLIDVFNIRSIGKLPYVMEKKALTLNVRVMGDWSIDVFNMSMNDSKLDIRKTNIPIHYFLDNMEYKNESYVQDLRDMIDENTPIHIYLQRDSSNWKIIDIKGGELPL